MAQSDLLFPANAAQPALIFMPDISGFTHFVSETEISHSQHIIAELLEVLIEANELDLELSEIEGDAILFYRFGAAPEQAAWLSQVQKMYLAFHAHLRKYEMQRICQCGACGSAHRLSLKFVSHFGEITLSHIKGHQKLFGKEVIVAHRLLKNEVPHAEYALMTLDLQQAMPATDFLPDWINWTRRSAEYDAGPIEFQDIDLAPLQAKVADPQAIDFGLPAHRQHLLHLEQAFEASLDQVFHVITDLRLRSHWTEGALLEIADVNHQIIQEGATHRCLADGPVFVTHDFRAEPGRVTFTETTQRKDLSIVFQLWPIGHSRSRMEVDVMMSGNRLKAWFFRTFVKRKFVRTAYRNFARLAAYCQQVAQGNYAGGQGAFLALGSYEELN